LSGLTIVQKSAFACELFQNINNGMTYFKGLEPPSGLKPGFTAFVAVRTGQGASSMFQP
jgi:hypothetical protein